MLTCLLLPLHRSPGLLTLWSALSVRRSTIKCFSSCCRSNGPNTVWTRSGSVVRAPCNQQNLSTFVKTRWSSGCAELVCDNYLCYFGRFHRCHKETGGCWGSESQRACESADSPNVSAAGQTHALCQQSTQLHHDQGETAHRARISTAKSTTTLLQQQWLCGLNVMSCKYNLSTAWGK